MPQYYSSGGFGFACDGLGVMAWAVESRASCILRTQPSRTHFTIIYFKSLAVLPLHIDWSARSKRTSDLAMHCRSNVRPRHRDKAGHRPTPIWLHVERTNCLLPTQTPEGFQVGKSLLLSTSPSWRSRDLNATTPNKRRNHCYDSPRHLALTTTVNTVDRLRSLATTTMHRLTLL